MKIVDLQALRGAKGAVGVVASVNKTQALSGPAHGQKTITIVEINRISSRLRRGRPPAMSDGPAVNSNSKTNYEASQQSSKQCFNCSNARQLFLQLAFVSSLQLCRVVRAIHTYIHNLTLSMLHISNITSAQLFYQIKFLN